MDFRAAIEAVLAGRGLSEPEMGGVMQLIMSGGLTPAQVAGLLIALRMKGETVSEIAGAARVMRALAAPMDIPKQHLIDTCGTGGDGAGTFNISTASALVAAAAGARVAKHGNRSVSSRSGSADVLEAAGVKIDLTPPQVARCIEEIGIGFLFAPAFHEAMRHTVAARRELGVRTLFNLLGPLTNPAGALRQVLGVFDKQWTEPLARVLQMLGSEHVVVVHGADGIDELSLSGVTHVSELHGGQISSYTLIPEQFGLARAGRELLVADGPEQSLAMIRSVLDGRPGPALDVVSLNAGAAIYVAGLAASIAEGISHARAAVFDGRARDKLGSLCRLSQSLATV